MVKVGTASANPGEKGRGLLKLLELSDGSPINVPVIVANGRKQGPTLWIECAMHGDEVASVYALLQTMKEIDPARLNGILIAVPVANVIGYNMHVGSLGWWTGGYMSIEAANLNRVFPGNPEGTFAERYAHALYEAIKKSKADYIVDAHGVYASGGGNSVDFVVYNGEAPVAKKSEELAKSSGFEVILSDGSSGSLRGTLVNVIAGDGIPAICTETEKPPKLQQAFANFLKHLQMIQGKPTPAKFQKVYKEPTKGGQGEVSVKRGGLLCPKVEEKDEVSKGQLLAVVSNLFGEEVEKIVSPVDGFVLYSVGAFAVKPGDVAFQIVIPR